MDPPGSSPTVLLVQSANGTIRSDLERDSPDKEAPVRVIVSHPEDSNATSRSKVGRGGNPAPSPAVDSASPFPGQVSALSERDVALLESSDARVTYDAGRSGWDVGLRRMQSATRHDVVGFWLNREVLMLAQGAGWIQPAPAQAEPAKYHKPFTVLPGQPACAPAETPLSLRAKTFAMVCSLALVVPVLVLAPLLWAAVALTGTVEGCHASIVAMTVWADIFCLFSAAFVVMRALWLATAASLGSVEALSALGAISLIANGIRLGISGVFAVVCVTALSDSSLFSFKEQNCQASPWEVGLVILSSWLAFGAFTLGAAQAFLEVWLGPSPREYSEYKTAVQDLGGQVLLLQMPAAVNQQREETTSVWKADEVSVPDETDPLLLGESEPRMRR
jgi:hypothetical protein